VLTDVVPEFVADLLELVFGETREQLFPMEKPPADRTWFRRGRRRRRPHTLQIVVFLRAFVHLLAPLAGYRNA